MITPYGIPRFPRMSAAPLAALVVALLSCAASPCAAQSPRMAAGEPAWLSLERGKSAFSAKDFGQALVYFDEAIAARRDSFTAAAGRLAQALETKAAKSGGDSVRAVLAAFASEDFIQRDYTRLAAGRAPSAKPLLEDLRKERISDSHRAFVDVLLLTLEYRAMEVLDDSIERLRAQVLLLARYPEAEYWKGRVFFLEGELSLAEVQYKRAFDMSVSLEIPEEIHTVLYSMAELYGARSAFVEWENVMKRIVEGNEASIDSYLLDAMMTTLLDSGFDRFMTLYRIEPAYSLEAHSELAAFYLERGRAAAVEHAAIAVNMTVTRAIAMLAAKDRDYTWKGLGDFSSRALARKDVSSYLSGAGWPKLLMSLADSLYVAGSREAARTLWSQVSASGADPYSAVARSRLSDPSSAVKR